MNRINSWRLLTALGVSVAVAIGASSISAAQPAPRPLPGNPSYNQDRQAPPDRRDDGQYNRRDDRLERRLDYLRSELRITPAQERLWDDFASVVRDTAERGPVRGPGFGRDRGDFRGPPDDRGAYRDDRRDAPSILDRLERRQQNLADQNDRLNRLVTALRPLYAALSADQKRTADRELFNPRGGDGHGRFTRFDTPRNRPYFDREYR
ncbi:MAG TPA: Spy/CpxP family protein refolding chaperone [Micropepsaceae bacterium]|nr:Spy/CpxP family protein refolding chaperone [Micropepsaceae bacterium]